MFALYFGYYLRFKKNDHQLIGLPDI